MKNNVASWLFPEWVLRTWHGQKDYKRIYGLNPYQAKPKPKITFNSIAEFSDALIRAKEAHVEFERGHGPDANWPLWYAAYLAMEQGIGKPNVKVGVCKMGSCGGQSLIPSQFKSEPSWGFGGDDGSKVDIGKEEEKYWSVHE